MSIEVTDEEIEKIANLILNSAGSHGPHEAIRKVFDSLNRIREGDPVGTVRRSPSGLTHVMKTDTSSLPWFSDRMFKERYWHTDEQVKDWTIVYDPTVGK